MSEDTACRDLSYIRRLIIENRFCSQSKAPKKGTRDSTAKIRKLHGVQEILFKKSIMCSWEIITRLLKKKTGSLKLRAADCGELHKQLLL